MVRFLSRQSKTLLGAGAMLAFFNLASRFAGLFRDRILASRFGASDILDVYYISFNIPDFVFNLLVAGTVSAAFIPIFIEYQSKKEGQEWNLAANFLNFLFLAVIFASTAMFIFAPLLIGIIAPGFSAPKAELAVLFTRVMLLSPIIFSVSIVIGSVLQIFHRFLAFSVAPIFYNLGIIIGAVALEPKFGPLGLAEGVVLGALLHLAVQFFGLKSAGFAWKAVLNWAEPGMRKIFYLMIPRALGLAVTQINWIILSAIATTISAGSVAIFNFANNLQYLPVALIGIPAAVASFPTLSREALKEDKKEFIARISGAFRVILFIIVPVSLFMIYFSGDIVRLVLGAGKFGIKDVRLTSLILGLFGIGIFAQGIVPFISRAFYAMQNTRIPVISAVASIAAGIGIVFPLVNYLRAGGANILLALPVAFSGAAVLNLILLLAALKIYLRGFNAGGILGYFFKVLSLSVAALVPAAYLAPILNLGGDLGALVLRLVATGLIGGLTFCSLCFIFGIEEVRRIVIFKNKK